MVTFNSHNVAILINMVKTTIIPKNMRVVSQTGTELVLQQKTRGRKKFKLPAKTRQKMAAAARRIKIPVLTTVAVGIPLTLAFEAGGGVQNSLTTSDGFFRFGRELLGSYTGVFISGSQATFDIKRAAVGLLPLVAVGIARRSGIFKTANAALSKAKIPIALR